MHAPKNENFMHPKNHASKNGKKWILEIFVLSFFGPQMVLVNKDWIPRFNQIRDTKTVTNYWLPAVRSFSTQNSSISSGHGANAFHFSALFSIFSATFEQEITFCEFVMSFCKPLQKTISASMLSPAAPTLKSAWQKIMEKMLKLRAAVET